MKFDKFTLKAQEAIATAQQIAMAKSHTVMSPLHLLSVVCSDDAGVAVEILKKIGSNIPRIKEMTQSELDRLPEGKSSDQLMCFGSERRQRAFAAKLGYAGTD